MLAFHAKSDDVPRLACDALMQASPGDEDWWFAGGHLYDVSFAPIVAGANNNQSALGRMAIGRELSTLSLANVGAFGQSAFVFERNGSIILSSFPDGARKDFQTRHRQQTDSPDTIQEIKIDGERYLASFVDLPGDHPVRLYSLQSFDQATIFLGSLDRTLLVLGALAVLAGALIAFVLSRQITRPLEHLALASRQMQKGDFESKIPVRERRSR